MYLVYRPVPYRGDAPMVVEALVLPDVGPCYAIGAYWWSWLEEERGRG